MNKINFSLFCVVLTTILSGCSSQFETLDSENLVLINREISSVDKSTNSISLDAKMGDGIARIKDAEFSNGIIEIDLMGENTPGRSFVGFAFNIQNDSTYEAIYFRPFNFQSKEKIRREHSIQYISHPKHNWRFLRTNFEGQYEAEFPRQPSPEEWFSIRIEIEDETVSVHEKDSEKKLLSVQRLSDPKSKKVGLWMGNNSKGKFKNLSIKTN